MNLANLIHVGHMRLWVAATVIASLIVAGFLLSVPHTRDIVETAKSPASPILPPTVTLRDIFKKGVHTITGSVEASNACATVTAQASLDGESPETKSILVALSLQSDTGVCLQVPTRVNFSTTLAAPARLPMTATVNGLAATTTAS